MSPATSPWPNPRAVLSLHLSRANPGEHVLVPEILSLFGFKDNSLFSVHLLLLLQLPGFSCSALPSKVAVPCYCSVLGPLLFSIQSLPQSVSRILSIRYSLMTTTGICGPRLYSDVKQAPQLNMSKLNFWYPHLTYFPSR